MDVNNMMNAKNKNRIFNTTRLDLDYIEHDCSSRDGHELLEKVKTTPIGQLLQKIAAVPEIREDKVNMIRQQIASGEYESQLDSRLDFILEEVLGDI